MREVGQDEYLLRVLESKRDRERERGQDEYLLRV